MHRAADRPPLFALALAAGACLAYLLSELSFFSGRLVFPLDDSWIHLQFARRLAAGDGLAYNPAGPWVPGSTAPLWTALLAPGFLLPAATWLAPAWAKLLGCFFFLATVHATDRLAAALGLDGGLRRLAAVLVATTHWLVWSALSGLEIGLFTCTSLWGIVLHLRERECLTASTAEGCDCLTASTAEGCDCLTASTAEGCDCLTASTAEGCDCLTASTAEGCDAPGRLPLSLPVFALAALARPEGYLLLALAVAERLIRPGESWSQLRQRAVPGLLCAAMILLPTLLFYRFTGGSFLPTTFAVKAGAPAHLLPSAAHLRTVLGVVFDAQPLMLLLAGAGALRLAERLGDRGRGSLLPVLWPLGLALAYSLLAPAAGPAVVGNFGRYYFPVLPVIAVLGTLGLERTARRWRAAEVGPMKTSARRWTAAALILAPQLWGIYRGPMRYLQTAANVEDSDVRAARWLGERLPEQALLAVQDIGALKYFLPNPIVDLTGIVNPDILPFLEGRGPDDPVYWEQRLLAYLERKKPDYLVVFPRSYPMLTSPAPGFAEVRSFPVPRNVTMAGDEIAVFSTPWTRHPLAETGE